MKASLNRRRNYRKDTRKVIQKDEVLTEEKNTNLIESKHPKEYDVRLN